MRPVDVELTRFKPGQDPVQAAPDRQCRSSVERAGMRVDDQPLRACSPDDVRTRLSRRNRFEAMAEVVARQDSDEYGRGGHRARACAIATVGDQSVDDRGSRQPVSRAVSCHEPPGRQGGKRPEHDGEYRRSQAWQTR